MKPRGLIHGKAYPERAISHIISDVGGSGQGSLWWESERLLVEVGVSARLPFLMKVVHESLVEAEQTRPVIDERHRGNVVCDNVVRNGWVVDHDRIEVVVGSVRGVMHRIGNVGDARRDVSCLAVESNTRVN